MDINNDGNKDLMAGDSGGNIWLFLNTGTKETPRLAKGILVEADGKPIKASRKTYKKENGKHVVDKIVPGSHTLAEIYSKIHVSDWDGDGLKDLLVGHNQTIILYKNVGTETAHRFQAPTLIKAPEGVFPSRPSPYVIDLDGDGKKDLLVGSERPKIYFYRNIGTDSTPQLAKGKVLDLKGDGFEDGYRCRIDVTDWNNDGELDILAGNFYSNKKPAGGNIWLFLSVAIPSSVKVRSPSEMNTCINNLRQMDAGKEQWALANKRSNGDQVDIRGVNEYIKGNRTPICPSGGKYTYSITGVDPQCSVPGHALR